MYSVHPYCTDSKLRLIGDKFLAQSYVSGPQRCDWNLDRVHLLYVLNIHDMWVESIFCVIEEKHQECKNAIYVFNFCK